MTTTTMINSQVCSVCGIGAADAMTCDVCGTRGCECLVTYCWTPSTCKTQDFGVTGTTPPDGFYCIDHRRHECNCPECAAVLS